jgi:hypothetical protein
MTGVFTLIRGYRRCAGNASAMELSPTKTPLN